MRRTTLIAMALALSTASCSGGSTPSAAPPATRAASAATIELGNETFVAVRTLPRSALSAEQLEAAGTATSNDGGNVPVARANTPDAAPWELVSAAPDGWRVWRPRAVLDAITAAGAGASLVAVERVAWPDTCLGAARAGEVCAQVVTPGYRVTLARGGQRLEFHTSLSGGARLANQQ